jgi:phage shock protein A
MAKHAIHDKLESQIRTAEAKLETLKARAQSAKANAEIKMVAGLLTKQQAIKREMKALKKLGGEKWERAKSDLEARIAHFEKSVRGIKSKSKKS